MSRKGWTGYGPMGPRVFEPIADKMLLGHAQRVALSGVMLEALAEKHPEKWGLIAEEMQDMILNAYESCSINALAETLAVVETVYRDIARSLGTDPDTGKMGRSGG
jgi:hypothetical protein